MPETSSTKQIDRTMTIDSILSLFPDRAQKLTQALSQAGLQCVGCHAATWETLEAGMYGHGKTDAEIDALVTKLNLLLQEKVCPDTITLTPRAAAKYLSILEEEGKQGWGVRLGEKMAGCNGFEYILDYQEKALPSDKIFISEGIEIYVDQQMVSRLIGSEIDYVEGLQNSGFTVTNPNVRSACGCGSSHGY